MFHPRHQFTSGPVIEKNSPLTSYHRANLSPASLEYTFTNEVNPSTHHRYFPTTITTIRWFLHITSSARTNSSSHSSRWESSRPSPLESAKTPLDTSRPVLREQLLACNKWFRPVSSPPLSSYLSSHLHWRAKGNGDWVILMLGNTMCRSVAMRDRVVIHSD